MGTDNSLAEKTVTSWTCTSNATADMNAKYALALILALQVSMSLCEIPAPSQELVEKYDEMKANFYKRILNAYNNLQGAAAPYMQKVGDHEHGQAAREYVESLQSSPRFQASVKIVTGMGQEVAPLLDEARTSFLGLYDTYLRPQIGTQLSDAIDNIKVYLDKYLPAE